MSFATGPLRAAPASLRETRDCCAAEAILPIDILRTMANTNRNFCINVLLSKRVWNSSSAKTHTHEYANRHRTVCPINRKSPPCASHRDGTTLAILVRRFIMPGGISPMLAFKNPPGRAIPSGKMHPPIAVERFEDATSHEPTHRRSVDKNLVAPWWRGSVRFPLRASQ